MTSTVAHVEQIVLPLSWFCGLLLIIRAREHRPTQRTRPMPGWQLVVALVFACEIAQLWIDDWRPFAGDALVLVIHAMIATWIVRKHPFPVAYARPISRDCRADGAARYAIDEMSRGDRAVADL